MIGFKKHGHLSLIEELKSPQETQLSWLFGLCWNGSVIFLAGIYFQIVKHNKNFKSVFSVDPNICALFLHNIGTGIF